MDKKFVLARNLRKNMTTQEYKLWNLLRNRQFEGVKFVRQYPIGPYIVDFVSRTKKLIIELDGGQHNFPENIKQDNERTMYLEERGYKVIRFWNNDVDNNLEGVYLEIMSYLK